MNQITIQGKAYEFVYGYRNLEKFRTSFFKLAKEVFSLDFQAWYNSGNWGDNYIPYSLWDGERIVANVSVNIMEFTFHGETKHYIQLGTVMTSDDSRNLGLNRYLIDKIFEIYENTTDLIYLFANKSVIDYYPKFGFLPMDEWFHKKSLPSSFISQGPVLSTEKLNFDKFESVIFLRKKITAAKPLNSKLYMQNNTGLIFFYALSFMRNDVYYIKELDAVVFAKQEKGILDLIDVFAPTAVDLDTIIRALADGLTREVHFGFTPAKLEGCVEAKKVNENDTLFMLGKDVDLYQSVHVRFPELSHA